MNDIFEDHPEKTYREMIEDEARELFPDDRTAQLDHLARAGEADDDELTELFGTELLQRMYVNAIGHEAAMDRFYDWFREVIAPIEGIGMPAALSLFTGTISIEAFCDSMNEATLTRFCERYPALQDAHQDKLEASGTLS